MEGEPMNLQIKSKKDESLRISLAQQKQSESLVTEEGADKGAADILAAQSPEQQAAALQNMSQEELDALTANLNTDGG